MIGTCLGAAKIDSSLSSKTGTPEIWHVGKRFSQPIATRVELVFEATVNHALGGERLSRPQALCFKQPGINTEVAQNSQQPDTSDAAADDCD